MMHNSHTRKKKFISLCMGSGTRRKTAIILLLVFVSNIILPTQSFALTGGPSQPEVQSFEPVGTSDMVDLFSGDFTYNIPLLDVDGYPINISYHSGITMDQEASWTGLGWNINVGTINRAMRGIPDDFNGDEIVKESNMKPNRTYGVTGTYDWELFGDKKPKDTIANINFGVSLGVRYNNYMGMAIEKGINLPINAGKFAKGPFSGNLGISSSTDNGLTISPSASYQKRFEKGQMADNTLTASVGTSYNSRSGLKQLSINTNISKSYTAVDDGKKKAEMAGKTVGGTYSIANAGAAFDFGMPTYSHSGGMNMHNISITGSFKLNSAIVGNAFGGSIQAYYSSQKLANTNVTRKAYGYMNHDEGVKHSEALLDFNRENDGSYNEKTPNLSLAQLTHDLYSVSGQGVGGSYRTFRSDAGYVFDPHTRTTSEGFNIGAELGIGNLNHLGADFAVTVSTSESGKWEYGNLAQSRLRYKAKASNSTYEPWYLKEANEKSVASDPDYFDDYGGSRAEKPVLREDAKFNVVLDKKLKNSSGGTIDLPEDNKKSAREKRNQVVTQLSRSELEAGLGINNEHPDSYNAPDHHIAEMTSLGNDGSRYVYGIAAYNTTQQEVSFATGKRRNLEGGRTVTVATGLTTYGTGDNSVDNNQGLDNYYSKTTIPAYAHSYLLTSILSVDYVDADHVKGPSNGDLGTWTKFQYSKHHDTAPFKWRTPVGSMTAQHNQGLKGDPHDDKSSYVYGEKEMWYLDTIITKNYIAIFEKTARLDGLGVLDENGQVDTDTTHAPKKLKAIKLYSLQEYRANPTTAQPIKVVHFEYDYSLCPHVPNNKNEINSTGSNTGKLTLKKIYFTYRGSNKAKFSPYEFTYASGSNNPDYSLKAYDRWGNYKPDASNSLDVLTSPLSNADYSYVDQNKTNADNYMQAWHMTSILLPSGGTINIDYESDDYAYVQDKRAGQMFKVVGFDNTVGATNDLVDIHDGSKGFLFALQPGYNTISDYNSGEDYIYYRFLMQTINDSGDEEYEFVSGYAKKSSMQIVNIGGTDYGKIFFEQCDINDHLNGTADKSPIVKSALQFGRLNLSNRIYPGPEPIDENESFGLQLIENFLEYIAVSDILNIYAAAVGPNAYLYSLGRCKKAVIGKCWVRLQNPNMKKLGGGSRVKKIRMSDAWADMTGSAESTVEYGQEYDYTTDGFVSGQAAKISSGVATYEPQLGGDENSLKVPVWFADNDPTNIDFEQLLVPDDEHYQEEPIGESLYPSPSVGYQKVTVKNLSRTGVTKHATGRVVHEFYTAKQFPVIAERTTIDQIHHKTTPYSIASLLNLAHLDHMTASQGFKVELNDMHGKPRKQSVYAENQTQPISSVEYVYKSDVIGNDKFKLVNEAKVIHPDGTSSTEQIGVFFDLVNDYRQERSSTLSGAIQANLDAFIVTVPVPVPTFHPSLSYEETQFRTATMTKVIQRFGILDKVIAKDAGSTVSTDNLAYDSETGEVLLTKTTTDYNDQVYSMNYPVHWYYDEGMGQAYKNIGFETSSLSFVSGTATYANASDYFVPGDEVNLVRYGYRGWVTDVTNNSVTIVDKYGTPYNGISTALKVIRSGRRNMQTNTMASVTTLRDSLGGFNSNSFTNVLQASAIEFGGNWRTYCNCFDQISSPNPYTTNPYVLGTQGNYKPVKSWLHLAERTQSNYNNNTNIRRDGVFQSYTPFYRLSGGNWIKDERNWTFTSEVTEFSPYGQELENKDALGRYSGATFGYNQTLATAVAANARYKEIGFDNFEDYDFNPCADGHFKFNDQSPDLVTTRKHTGKTSVKVNSGTPVTLTRQLSNCDKEACHLELTWTVSPLNPNIYTLAYTGNNGTVTLDYDVIYGSPDEDFTGTTIIFTGSSYQIIVTATDASGCKTIETFTRP